MGGTLGKPQLCVPMGACSPIQNPLNQLAACTTNLQNSATSTVNPLRRAWRHTATWPSHASAPSKSHSTRHTVPGERPRDGGHARFSIAATSFMPLVCVFHYPNWESQATLSQAGVAHHITLKSGAGKGGCRRAPYPWGQNTSAWPKEGETGKWSSRGTAFRPVYCWSCNLIFLSFFHARVVSPATGCPTNASLRLPIRGKTRHAAVPKPQRPRTLNKGGQQAWLFSASTNIDNGIESTCCAGNT